jgi:APA family basic amino acid/polyamine antiporter
MTAVVAGLTLLGEVRLTWAFSAFSVLGYYALTHLAAWRQGADERRMPRTLNALGLAGCLGLAFFVPAAVWATGIGLVVVGLAWRELRLRRAAESVARARQAPRPSAG